MPEVPPHISAILSALRFSHPSREALRTLTDSEWNDLLSRWGILRLMVPLRQVCGDDLPEWVSSRIDRNLADNALRFERIKVVYEEFARALRETGAEHLVIKGFAQEPGFVEHPRQRLQSDIDIYCPPESLNAARALIDEQTIRIDPVWWIVAGTSVTVQRPAAIRPGRRKCRELKLIKQLRLRAIGVAASRADVGFAGHLVSMPSRTARKRA